jgi:hypothetical protein
MAARSSTPALDAGLDPAPAFVRDGAVEAIGTGVDF